MGTFLSVAPVGLLLAARSPSPQDGGPVVGWIAARQHELLDEYEAFLRLPNVATEEAAIRRRPATAASSLSRSPASSHLSRLPSASGRAASAKASRDRPARLR